jgi:hypothetical protein
MWWIQRRWWIQRVHRIRIEDIRIYTAIVGAIEKAEVPAHELDHSSRFSVELVLMVTPTLGNDLEL